MMNSSKKFFMLFLVVLLIVQSSFALGLMPSRKVIEFVSNSQYSGSLTLINSQHQEMNLVVYARGDLAKYVVFDDSIVNLASSEGEKLVKYKLSLPETLAKQGENLIEIVVEESPSAYADNTVVGGKIAVVQQLIVRSKIAGPYLDIKFSTNNPDSNQDLAFTYFFSNQGTEDVATFSAEVYIFNDKSELVDRKEYAFQGLIKGEQRKDTVALGHKIIPGNYMVSTTINYANQKSKQEVRFTIGGPKVEISSLESQSFKLGEINKVNILVYSQWSELMTGVSADIFVRNAEGNSKGVFKTISSDISPFSATTLTGYWDTTDFNPGKYFFNVVVSHNSKFTEKEFEVDVAQDSFSSSALGIVGRTVITSPKKLDSAPFLIIAFFMLVTINVMLFLYIKKKFDKSKEF